MTHAHLLHAIEIIGVFLCAHHFWPKGITYSEKEAWERKKQNRARRSKPTNGRQPRDRRDKDISRSRGGSVYEEEEVFVPRGIYRGDGSEFFPEMQAQAQGTRDVARKGSGRDSSAVSVPGGEGYNGKRGGKGYAQRERENERERYPSRSASRRGGGEGSDARRSSGSGRGRNKKDKDESHRRYRGYAGVYEESGNNEE